ncbi:MAG: hypothetical protein EBX19_09685 [Actinobacteria bacterium]|nr:hypothetical protein [Actinomycetota bacterium]
MKNEAEWWTPDELAATEERIRLGLRDTTPDVRNDYGSYGALAGGADPVTVRRQAVSRIWGVALASPLMV